MTRLLILTDEQRAAVIAGSDLVQALADTSILTLAKEQQEQFVKVCRLTIDALKKLAAQAES